MIKSIEFEGDHVGNGKVWITLTDGTRWSMNGLGYTKVMHMLEDLLEADIQVIRKRSKTPGENK